MPGWTSLIKETFRIAGKGVKVAYPHVKTTLHNVLQPVKGVGHWVEKNPKTSVVGLGIALPHLGYDKGLINYGIDVFGGAEAKEKGVAKTSFDLLLGKEKDANGNDKSVVEKAGETLLGEEGYDNLKGTMGAGYDHLKQGTQNLVTGVGNFYQNGMDTLGGLFSGNGMVNNGQGNYYDPTTPSYPSMNQMTGMSQGNGILSGLMGGMNSVLNTVSGGNVSKLNLAGLLIAAYMLFGRFGWMGKAASLMLGGMTLKNINNRQQPQMMQQQGSIQNAVLNTPSTNDAASATINNDEENVVVRSRGR